MDNQNALIAAVGNAVTGEVERLGLYLAGEVEGCELCSSPGGEMLWEDDFCRVVRVADADYPGFCRVIVRRHVAEMTDLSMDERSRLMSVVFTVEEVVRSVFLPDKINLASFGNVVPHLHWHVIPRWRDDRHFPQPIWGSAQRVSSPARAPVPNFRLATEIGARIAQYGKGESI